MLHSHISRAGFAVQEAVDNQICTTCSCLKMHVLKTPVLTVTRTLLAQNVAQREVIAEELSRVEEQLAALPRGQKLLTRYTQLLAHAMLLHGDIMSYNWLSVAEMATSSSQDACRLEVTNGDRLPANSLREKHWWVFPAGAM